MEKEKYEKPELEVIDLLSEIFTQDSTEGTEGGDIFDDDEEETEDETETTDKDIEDELDEDGNPIDKSNNGLTSMPPEESDPSLLGNLLDELSSISKDIQLSMSGETGTGDSGQTKDTNPSESEIIEETPVENNTPAQDTFEEPTQTGEETGGFE